MRALGVLDSLFPGDGSLDRDLAGHEDASLGSLVEDAFDAFDKDVVEGVFLPKIFIINEGLRLKFKASRLLTWVHPEHELFKMQFAPERFGHVLDDFAADNFVIGL